MHSAPASSAGNANFGPKQAAALLDQATQQARRKLQPTPPWLLVNQGSPGPGRLWGGLALGARAESLPGPDGRRRACLSRFRCDQLHCNCRGGQARDCRRKREVAIAPGRDCRRRTGMGSHGRS